MLSDGKGALSYYETFIKSKSFEEEPLHYWFMEKLMIKFLLEIMQRRKTTMKKLLYVLIACLILAAPVMAQNPTTPTDELSGLSNQQLLAVYDAVVGEIQKRGVDTSAQTVRDSSIVFGQNVHIQTGQLSLCLPTAVPTGNQQVQLPIAPTATPVQVGDKASYDSQQPADFTHVQRGQSFDITWYLLNTGTTTWTEDYCLRFWSGDNMTKPGKPRYYLLEPTAPNTVGRIRVDVIAPASPGTYTMSMVFGNQNDENFFIVDTTIIVD